MGLVVACSDSDEGTAEQRTWRCRTSPTPEGMFCECKLGTDAELQSEGIEPAEFPYDSCPASNYKCCEDYGKATASDATAECICWNPEAASCDGDLPMVPGCPQ